MRSFILVPCTNGWSLYDRRCYLVVKSPHSWPDAEDNCQSLNSHLVDIRDANEDNFVINAVTSAMGKASYFWIGLNDLETNGTFVYTSGALVTYTSYGLGQPSVISEDGTEENCFEITASREWNDKYCNWPLVSVCVKPHY